MFYRFMNIYILAVKHVRFFLLKVNERGTTALNFEEKSKKNVTRIGIAV